MRDDLYRLRRISEIGHRLLDTLRDLGVDRAALSADYRLQWMVATPLFDIGEQANCLSEGFVREHPEQPWAAVAGLRHRLVHDYEGTNWDLVGSVIAEELGPLLDAVDGIVAEMEDGADAS